MSELTELKNKRIFGSVFEVHVNQSLRCQVDPNEDTGGVFFNLYSAVFYGAAKLGTSMVQSVPSVKEAWGEPDLERADMIFKACCLPMISIASRRIAEEKDWTEAQKADVTRSRFEDVANILQTGMDIDYCMGLDTQYNYDSDDNKDNVPGLQRYAYLFYQKVRESLAMSAPIDWESIKYPMANTDSFTVTAEEYAEIIIVAGLIMETRDLMFRAFEKYTAE